VVAAGVPHARTRMQCGAAYGEVLSFEFLVLSSENAQQFDDASGLPHLGTSELKTQNSELKTRDWKDPGCLPP